MYKGLNHIYRLVWDCVRETWVPVSEHCKSGPRRGLLTGKLVVLAITSLPAVGYTHGSHVDNALTANLGVSWSFR